MIISFRKRTITYGQAVGMFNVKTRPLSFNLTSFDNNFYNWAVPAVQ